MNNEQQYIMFSEWYAVEDNVIGGWCIRPTSGNLPVAIFSAELFAIHIVALHNAWLVEARKVSQPKSNDVTQVIEVVEPFDDHSELY